MGSGRGGWAGFSTFLRTFHHEVGVESGHGGSTGRNKVSGFTIVPSRGQQRKKGQQRMGAGKGCYWPRTPCAESLGFSSRVGPGRHFSLMGLVGVGGGGEGGGGPLLQSHLVWGEGVPWL